MSVKEIIVDVQQQKGTVKKIMENRTKEAEEELEELKLKRLITEEKQRIKEAQDTGQKADFGLATDFTDHIMQMAQVDPQKAKQFLESLDEENMNKLAYLNAMDNDKAGALLRLTQSSGTKVQDLVEIVKLMRPSNGGVDLKGVAEVFKLGMEASKPQGQPGSMMEGWKEMYGTFVKPFVDALQENQQKLVEARMSAIEAKIPPPLEQQIGYIKTMASELGFSNQGGKTSEFDLKLEDMKQTREIDIEKLRWEQRKYLLETERDRDKWSAIQETFAPIFEMNAPEIQNTVRKLGADIGKTINIGQPGQPGQPEQPETQVSTKQITCPKCSQTMQVPDPLPPNVQSIKCPNPECGTLIPAKETQQTSTPPPEEPPERVKSLRPQYR